MKRAEFNGSPPTLELLPKGGRQWTEFFSWLRAYSSSWDHVKVRGVALRVGELWMNAGLLVEAAGNARDDSPGILVDDGLALVFSAVLPKDKLPTLVRDVSRGRLKQDTLPFLRREIVVQSPVGRRYRLGSFSQIDRRFGRLGASVEASRVELDWEGNANFGEMATHESAKGAVYLQRVNERFRLSGYGTLSAVSHQLGISENSNRINANSRPVVRFRFSMPVWIANASQRPHDRSRLDVQLGVHPIAAGSDVSVLLEIPGGTTPYPQASVKLPASKEVTVCLCVDVGTRTSEGTLLLTYRDRVVQYQNVVLRPRLHTSVRYSTITSLDPNERRLRRDLGIAASGEDVRLDAYRFEAAVAHLLSILGFCCVWWGEKTVRPQKRTRGLSRAANPDDRPDLVVFTPSDTTVLLVECTTASFEKDKLRKLVQRREDLRRKLQGVTGDAPDVLCAIVYASGVPSGPAAAMIDEHSIAAIGPDELRRAHDSLRRGVGVGEVLRGLGEPWDSAFKSTPQIPVF